MALPREALVGLLDLGRTRLPTHPQYLVVVHAPHEAPGQFRPSRNTDVYRTGSCLPGLGDLDVENAESVLRSCLGGLDPRRQWKGACKRAVRPLDTVVVLLLDPLLELSLPLQCEHVLRDPDLD